ncbi:MAG: hypothetical protein IPG50_08895 [Myxococcales bacterium]|nr:hypothetical protein [Myxococcales bacterium]
MWLVVSPGRAATSATGAGLCSHHGTSEVAPSPLMIPIEQSLEQGDSDCLELEDGRSVRPGEERFEPGPQGDAVLPTQRLSIKRRQTTEAVPQAAEGGACGVCSTLERPPRG